MIRVLICDDQEVVREGLKVILGTSAEVEVVGLAEDGADALDKVAYLKPDIVLMDLKMPHMNGVKATRLIRERYPEVRVLVLTTYDADEWVFDAIRSGAAGYLLKDTPKVDLVEAMRNVIAGKTPVDPAVAGKLFNQITRHPPVTDTTMIEELSDREVEVLKYLARGLTNAQIAAELHLSEGTVRNYVSSLFTKLEVADRTQAAIFAMRYGIVNMT